MNAELSLLLQKVKLGDKKAFEEIYHRYHSRISGFCLKNGQTQADTEEVVQEVFLKLWTLRAQIDPNKNIEAFIIKISKNIIVDKFRRLVRHRAAQDYQIYTLRPVNNTEEEINYKELRDQISEIIDTLPEIRRLVFQMSRVQDLSNQEIAIELGISIRTVENHISKALQAFNENFRNQEPFQSSH